MHTLATRACDRASSDGRVTADGTTGTTVRAGEKAGSERIETVKALQMDRDGRPTAARKIVGIDA